MKKEPEVETVKYYKHYLNVDRRDVQVSMFIGILGILLINILIGFLIQNSDVDTDVGYFIIFLNGLGFIGTLIFLCILKKFKIENSKVRRYDETSY